MRRFIQLRLWPDLQICIVAFRRSEEEAKRDLADAADYCRAHGHDVETHWGSGGAQELLLPFADQWQADLLVIGSSRMNYVMRKLFGETTLHVIRNAKQAIFMSQ